MNFEDVLDPLLEIERQRARAEAAGVALPESMTVATVDASGDPRARVVLLKEREGRKLRFYTNYESDKATELDRHPRAALCIHYATLQFQARILGTASKVSAAVSDAYFATRPRESQLGAWASQQSRPLARRADLESAYEHAAIRFAGAVVTRPPHWGGYEVLAESVELWFGAEGRLHERARYTFSEDAWVCQRLFP